MNYIEVKLLPNPSSEAVCDVLAALLAPLGYDSFSSETDDSGSPFLQAYVTQAQWDSEALNALLADLPLDGVEVSWVASEVEMQDWNSEWEQSQQFEPIVIGEDGGEVLCCVHSPSTPADRIPACRYEVIIDPKMSFGTGTHETTSQLLDEILRVNEELGMQRDASGMRALDMGTGTGVLGILCAQLGYQVRAIEIDDWVAANAVDNVLYNGMAGRMQVECGDASLLTEGPAYDLVLANINRNILLADMHCYASVMLPGATLLLSGFYEEDVPALTACAQSLGLTFISQRSRNGWTVCRYCKTMG